jgi:hypothetical protein
MQKTAFYRVDPSLLVNNSLVISGAVYASDFITPLPEVLIEFWQTQERHPAFPATFPEASSYAFPASFPAPPHYVFRVRARTDTVGHYQTTVLKPDHGNILTIYYRSPYQNRCLLALQLLLVDERALADLSKVSSGKESPPVPCCKVRLTSFCRFHCHPTLIPLFRKHPGWSSAAT